MVLVVAAVVALMFQSRSTDNPAPSFTSRSAQQIISASAASWALSVAPSRWSNGSHHLSTLKTISPIDRQLTIGDTTQLLVTSPDFLDDHHLLLAYDENWHAGRLALFFISDAGGNLYRLDGLSPIINILRDKVRINSTNVEAYLRFFNFFTRATDGPFIVVQSASDSMAPRLQGNARISEAERHYAPVDCELEGNVFQCAATIFYSNAVFFARFSIDRAGAVSMTGDELKVEDLPVRPDFPIGRR